MTNYEWAENEIELLNLKDPYDQHCHKSALKAFKSLCEDEHSMFSINVTMNILNRLYKKLPLSEVNGGEDEWTVIESYGDRVTYQNKRYSSLFKDVFSDGKINYTDVQRAIVVDIDNQSDMWSGWESYILDELFPIKLPYYPDMNKYKIYVNHTHDEKGNITSYHIYYIIKPDGSKVEVNRLYDPKGVRIE